MRRLRLVGWLLGVAATGWFAVFAWRTATRFDLRSLASWPMLAAMGAAAIAYASIIPTSSWAWRQLLRATGVELPLVRLNVIMGLSQIAKYLPGNIGQHVGRAAMSLERGIPKGALFVSVAAETVLAVAAALFVGLLGLAAGRSLGAIPALRLRAPSLGLLAAAGAASAVLVVLAAGRSRFVTRWLAPYLEARAPGRARAVAQAFAAYVVNYLVIGLGLCAIAMAAVPLPPAAAPLFAGAFALSWAAGFVVPGAPAGLGVREGAMAALLAPLLDPAPTLEVIAAFRIATTCGDLLALGWGASLHIIERRAHAVGASAGGNDGA